MYYEQYIFAVEMSRHSYIRVSFLAFVYLISIISVVPSGAGNPGALSVSSSTIF